MTDNKAYSFEDDEYITFRIPKSLAANKEFLAKYGLDNDALAILGRMIPLSKDLKNSVKMLRETIANQSLFTAKGKTANDQILRKVSKSLASLKKSGLISVQEKINFQGKKITQLNVYKINPIWENFTKTKPSQTENSTVEKDFTQCKNSHVSSVNNYTVKNNSAENYTVENDLTQCGNLHSNSAEIYTRQCENRTTLVSISKNSKKLVREKIPQKIFNKFSDKNFYDLNAMAKKTCHEVVKSLQATPDTCFYVKKTNDGYTFEKKWEHYLAGIKSMLESKGGELRHPLELLKYEPDALENKLTLVLHDILTEMSVLTLKNKFKLTDDEDSFSGLANAIMIKFQNQQFPKKVSLWECMQDYVIKQVRAELTTRHDFLSEELFNDSCFEDLRANLRYVYENGHMGNPFPALDLCYPRLMAFEQLFHTPIFSKFLLERAMLAITIEAYHCEQWQKINQLFPTFNDYLKDLCDFQLKTDLDVIINLYPEILNDDIYQ